MSPLFLFVVSLALLAPSNGQSTVDFPSWFQTIPSISSGDYQSLNEIFNAQRITNFETLRSLTVTHLSSCGVPMGYAALLNKAAANAQDSAFALANTTAANTTANATVAVNNVVVKIELSNSTVTVTTTGNTTTIPVPVVATPAVSASVNATTAKRALRALRNKRTASFDWASWLSGIIVPAGNASTVASILSAHNIGSTDLPNLGAPGLQAAGLSAQDASAVLNNSQLVEFLNGCVNTDDIPSVLDICHQNRLNRDSLSSLSIHDMASIGIALGDATRIFGKAHPVSNATATVSVPMVVNLVLNTDDATHYITIPINTTAIPSASNATTAPTSISIAVPAVNTTTAANTTVAVSPTSGSVATVISTPKASTRRSVQQRSVQNVSMAKRTVQNMNEHLSTQKRNNQRNFVNRR